MGSVGASTPLVLCDALEHAAAEYTDDASALSILFVRATQTLFVGGPVKTKVIAWHHPLVRTWVHTSCGDRNVVNVRLPCHSQARIREARAHAPKTAKLVIVGTKADAPASLRQVGARAVGKAVLLSSRDDCTAAQPSDWSGTDLLHRYDWLWLKVQLTNVPCCPTHKQAHTHARTHSHTAIHTVACTRTCTPHRTPSCCSDNGQIRVLIAQTYHGCLFLLLLSHPPVQVTREAAYAVAAVYAVPYFETSSKTGAAVAMPFIQQVRRRDV